jgi:excisionase family DNA binding protein
MADNEHRGQAVNEYEWGDQLMGDKILLTVGEAADRLALGRTFVYQLVTRGEILSVKLGRARRIPVSALEDFTRRKLQEATWQ